MAVGKKRYYIHGDRYEPNASQYYCAECDLFMDHEHFAKPHREDNYSRHKAASKTIGKLIRSSKEYFRPSDPENLFS